MSTEDVFAPAAPAPAASRRLPVPALAVAGGLAACGKDEPPIVPATGAGPSPTPTAASSPTPVSTSIPAEKVTRPGATRAADRTSGSTACPSAKTLERVIGETEEALPEDWHFVQVRCWKAWATAGVTGPTHGDGVYLFRYGAGTGWRYHSQGSGYHCEDIGIHEPAPFCQYPG